jgi:hypothetical protein
MSEKSRHTTKLDIQRILKNNLAAINDWIVLRYTVLTYGNLERDIMKLIKKIIKYGIWKDVKGFEGLYEVSNTGDVRTIERTVLRKSKLGKLSEYLKNHQSKNLTKTKVDM